MFLTHPTQNAPVGNRQNQHYQEFSSVQIYLNPATLHFLIRTKRTSWNLAWGCLILHEFKLCKEAQRIPLWTDNMRLQLCNLSYPTMLYICKGSPAWQKGGWCPALWYCLLFTNLCRLILAQSSALHPEIFMAGKEFGLPCKTHLRHLRLPKQRASHWDNFERPSWKEMVFPSRIYPTVY